MRSEIPRICGGEDDCVPGYGVVVRVVDAEGRLRELLIAAGATNDAPGDQLAQKVWETYKTFAAEPVDEATDDPDADMLIFSHGISGPPEEAGVFSLMLTRQFVLHDSRGKYDHLEQLHCTIACDPTSELERIGFTEGVFLPAATHLEEWVRDVEQSAGFEPLMRARTHRLGIAQEHV